MMERFISYFPENDLFTAETETEVNGVTFGGSREGKETQYHTAVREGVEESSGILGDKKDVRNLIKYHLMGKIHDKAYSIWLVEVEYNPEIVPASSEIILKMHLKIIWKPLKNTTVYLRKINYNGLNYPLYIERNICFDLGTRRFIPQIIEVLK